MFAAFTLTQNTSRHQNSRPRSFLRVWAVLDQTPDREGSGLKTLTPGQNATSVGMMVCLYVDPWGQARAGLDLPELTTCYLVIHSQPPHWAIQFTSGLRCRRISDRECLDGSRGPLPKSMV